jgi:hypothetical protein
MIIRCPPDDGLVSVSPPVGRRPDVRDGEFRHRLHELLDSFSGQFDEAPEHRDLPRGW